MIMISDTEIEEVSSDHVLCNVISLRKPLLMTYESNSILSEIEIHHINTVIVRVTYIEKDSNMSREYELRKVQKIITEGKKISLKAKISF